MLARQVNRRQVVRSLVDADVMSDAEALREQPNQFRIDLVDTAAEISELVVGHRPCF